MSFIFEVQNHCEPSHAAVNYGAELALLVAREAGHLDDDGALVGDGHEVYLYARFSVPACGLDFHSVPPAFSIAFLAISMAIDILL